MAEGRTLLRLSLVALLVGLAATAPAAATGEVISAIEFSGLRSLPEETLKYYLGIDTGKPLDEQKLDENIHALWKRGLIDDIRIEQVRDEGGVRLKVTIVERPVLRSIEYQGLKRVSRTDLNEKMAKEQIEVREGNPVNLGELQRLRNLIEEMYRDKGYRFAEARYTLEPISPSERRVKFAIDEGDRVRIQKIRFPGAKVVPRWRMRLAMKKTKETGPIIRLFKKDIYNPATMQEDLGKVRDVYRARGYKNVVVGEPQIEVRALHPKAANPKQQKRRLFVTIPITEGQRWRLGEISIEGNEKFSDQALLRQFRKPRGGWLRAKAIDESIKNINEAYRNTGHLFASVSPELREKPENVADLVVKIEEGDQYAVGRMEFEGNTRTRDKVLRREFRVQEKSVLNMGAVKNSLYKVNQLGYFKLNEDDPIKFENFDSEKKTVDLQVVGEEADRTELQIGGGWSELDGFFGQVSVKTQNFLGRGESVGLAFQSGRYRDEFSLSYFVPWFLDKPQSIGLQLFKSDLDYSPIYAQTYVQKNQGATLTYGRSFGLFSHWGASYTISKVTDQRTLFQTDGTPLVQTFDLDNSSIRPYYSYESRDSIVEPTRGMHLRTSVEVAGGVLGGTTDYYKPEAGFNWFLPVSRVGLKTVFGINVEAGWIEPFGDYALTFLQQYYLGGETSVRGFQFRSIWVRCEGGETFGTERCLRNQTLFDQYGFPIGGNKYFQANAEFHLLLGGPFRLLGFVDAGNVYADYQSIDVGRLRYSAGAELRIFVPMFGAPLRFIYAKNLRPLADDKFQSFQFSIGATF